MKTELLEVLSEKPINVNGVQRQPGETFENPKSGDIKALLKNSYLQKVKGGK